MKKGKKKTILPIFLTLIILLFVLNSTMAQEETPAIHIRILETTDLHGNMIGYDYNNGKPTVEFGLSRAASLIKQARKETANSLLFDVGDILEGNALGEYAFHSHPLNLANIHPVYKAMNALLYDAATVGNHEFNYGLDFLLESLRGANFPYVNANIFVEDQNDFEADDINFFNPYIIMNKKFEDSSGKMHLIKVGVIGFITPIVAEWDREYFRGKLIVKNIKRTAEHFIPIMKEKGADIIVALAHTGLEADKGLDEKKGNSVYSLSKVKGIDAILYGHSHSVFPVREELQKRNGMDLNAGTINGIAAVQAGYWGNHIGVIDIQLVRDHGAWRVEDSKSSVRPIYRTFNFKKKPVVPSDPLIEQIMEKDHKETLEYLKNKK